jgi:molybdopterin/thiamine biosynthesis adenylyltransferase
MLSDEQLLKYSRQIMLPQIDIEGQQKLANSHVVILGLGGLGSPVAMYLATAGIGEITLIDDDKVDLSNLQRQIVHQQSSQGQAKVESARTTMLALNPEIKLNIIKQRLDESELQKVLENADVVTDCCDNFETRFMLNRVCFTHKIPLVSGAAIRCEGQLTTFMTGEASPCYRCLYDEDSFTDQTCAQNGIVGPVVGIIGTMQALEVIKIITGAGRPAIGELTLFDGLDGAFSKIKYAKKIDCPVCG